MEQMDRIQKLHRIFSSLRYGVTLQQLTQQLQLSSAVVKKNINILRDRLYAPLEYDPSTKRWYYAQNHGDYFQLPGLWLTSAELLGLAATLNILDTMDAGLLDDDINSLRQPITDQLAARGLTATDFNRFIQFLPTTRRPASNHLFAMLTDTLITQRQLFIVYEDYHGKRSRRTISPQGLVYYQENWYLDAWCHHKHAPRSFMVSRIQKATRQAEKSQPMAPDERSAHFASAYGIFAGPATHTAVLRFSPPLAREAASVQWHREQTSHWEGQYYHLRVPYGDERELVRDLLRYGAGVRVIAPPSLRAHIINTATAILEHYCDPPTATHPATPAVANVPLDRHTVSD